MEAHGLVFRSIKTSGGVYDTQYSKISFTSFSTDAGKLFSGQLQIHGSRDTCHSVRSRKSFGFSNSGFSDNSHLQYYVSTTTTTTTRCEGKKKEIVVKEKGRDTERATMKKKLKLLKGLSKNLSMVSEMGVVDIGEDKGTTLSEVTQVLLAQLQELKAKKKEIKRKGKEEKMKLKALQMKSMNNASSSSSSESSDNECDEQVVNMNQLRNSTLVESKVDVLQATVDQAELSVTTTTCSSASECEELYNIPHKRNSDVVDDQQMKAQEDESLIIQSARSFLIEEEKMNSRKDCCTNSGSSSNCYQNGAVVDALAKRIDVCMGGKCKKFGAVALLNELEKKIGIEGVVVGCKCMGKCKNGPNVRVSNHNNEYLAEGVPQSNPLYIGVGLEDLDVIASNFLCEVKNNVGLIAVA